MNSTAEGRWQSVNVLQCAQSAFDSEMILDLQKSAKESTGVLYLLHSASNANIQLHVHHKEESNAAAVHGCGTHGFCLCSAILHHETFSCQ